MKLSPQARAGFQAFCDRHNVSLAAMLEAVGLLMSSGGWDDNEQVRTLVEEAKRIDVERSRRPGPRRRRYNR